MIAVSVFEGGEYVTDDNTVLMSEWSEAEMLRVLVEWLGDDWKDQDCTDMFTDGPKTCGESLNIIGDNLAQAVKCGTNGGQMYIVRR